MVIEFVPRRMVKERLIEGWRLIPGHEYCTADYAILMQLPAAPEPLTARRINTTAAQFLPRPTGMPNRSAASTSRNLSRSYSKLHRRQVERA